MKSQKTYFKVLNIAGEGLNSTVYRALREDFSGTISQEVALKVLRSKNSVSFWKQEVQSLLNVDSSFCVKVYGFEWVDGHPSMVLEWLQGVSLQELLKFHIPTIGQTKEISSQIYRGLMDLHMSRLSHGDLHPGNVFITTSGQIKLIDFGLANVSRASEQGSPFFRAPELDEGTVPNLWTDLYSLGRIVECLGGEPFNLIHESPNLRSFAQLISSLEGQRELGLVVKKILSQKKLQQESRTHVLKRSPLKNRGLSWNTLGVFSLSFFLATSSISQTLYPSEICPLKIRTQKWTHIQIGESIQKYAPIHLKRLPCHLPLKIHWRRQHSAGTLTLKPHKDKGFQVLTDIDFSLDQHLPN